MKARVRSNRRLRLALTGLAWCFLAGSGWAAEDSGIRLLVRGDDIGSSHAANVACIRCYREGIVRSVEVMVPAPWFNEAVKMLRENPDLDVGVHLTLTSEWENCRWGPVTQSPSLVDGEGHFFPTTSQRKDFSPNTGFLQAGPKPEEVERELRAQIELALDRIANVSHLSCHMGTASSTPELKALVERLAAEYGLPLDAQGARRAGRFGGQHTTPDEKEENLVRILKNLQPGLWLIVEHPGLDTPEMRAIGHHGYENVAEDRAGVTRAFTSPRVQEVIRRRGIQLVSYGDLSRVTSTAAQKR
jgi:predicted glycoside hydrolase/deacetylase ChbG (UPF0249 family)